MGMATSLVNGPWPFFSNLSFPQPKEALYEIWAKLAQRLQRRSHLKMLTDVRQMHRRWTKKWSLWLILSIAQMTPEVCSGWAIQWAKNRTSKISICRREGSASMDTWNTPSVQSRQPVTDGLMESIGPGRLQMTWKQLTERDRWEWKLSVINPHDGQAWRSTMCTAS